MDNEVYKASVVVDVVDRTEPAMSNIQRKTTAFERSIAGTGRRIQSWGRGLSNVGRSMTRWLTGPLLAAGAASLKMYADFQSSFTKIRALVGIGGKALERMRSQVLDLGRRMPQGPQALADALYFVTSSGFKGAAAMDVLKASAKAAAAGLGDTMTVADAVTSAVNAYGQANLSASRATDILLATVREGKSEPAELAGAIGRVIAPAEALGIEFHEVGAALASLSLVGLDAAEGVTGLRGAMMTFMGPTLKTRSAIKGLGMSVEEIQTNIRDKGFFDTMVDLRNEFGYTAEEAAALSKKPLGDLKASLGENKDAISDVFGNVRALNAFLALTGRNVEKNAEVHEALANAVGDTDRAYRKAARDPLNQFNVALANLRTTAIELAPTILPVAERILHVIEGWAKAISRLPEAKLERIVKILGAVMIAGPALRLAGGAMQLGGGAMRGFGSMGAWGRGGTTAGTSIGGPNPMMTNALMGAGILGAGSTGGTAPGTAPAIVTRGGSSYIQGPGGLFLPRGTAPTTTAAPAAPTGKMAGGFARAAGRAGQGMMVASMLAPFMPTVGRRIADSLLAGPGTRAESLGDAIKQNEMEDNNVGLRLSKQLLAGNAQALDKYKAKMLETANATEDENDRMMVLDERLRQSKYAVDLTSNALTAQEAKLAKLGGEMTKNERQGYEMARQSHDWGLASDILTRALERQRGEIDENGRQAAGAAIKFERLESVMNRIDGMTINAKINLLAVYGSLSGAAQALAQQSYGGGWEGAGFGTPAGGGGGGKGKGHDYPHTMRVRGPGLLRVGNIDEDISFSGPVGRGGGGGAHISFAAGAIVIRADTLDEQAMRKAADIVADQIAKDLDEHMSNTP